MSADIALLGPHGLHGLVGRATPSDISFKLVTTSATAGSFSVAGKDTSPTGIAFKTDGTVMYVVGTSSDSVHQYNLGTAWDVSTAVFGASKSVATEDTSPSGVAFKPDGTAMYVVGDAGADINQYALSSAWDVTTAVFGAAESVAAQDLNPRDIAFKPDGSMFFIVGETTDHVLAYTLSSAWDVTTSSHAATFTDTPGTLLTGITFSPDGARMFLADTTAIDDPIAQYTLGIPWDITTAAREGYFFVGATDATPQSIAFSSDGLKFYMLGDTNDTVYQYDLV